MLLELVDEFLQQYNLENELECEQTRKEFVLKYSHKRILSLPLIEYYLTGNQNAFYYHLQCGLDRLASMGNVYPDFYGVYIDGKGSNRLNKTLSKKYGTDIDAAFAHVKSSIVHLLEAGANDDYSAIRDSDVNSLIRFKLLSVYYPNKFFPVCAIRTAKLYCECVGVDFSPSDDMTTLNLKLVEWKKYHLPNDWSLHKTMCFTDWLWRNKKTLDSSFKLTLDSGLEITEKLESMFDNLHLKGEDREAIVKLRVNQNIFRDRLLTKFKHCALCNVNQKELLLASHIKPWSKCLSEEKLDVDNGLLMCPCHDKLFDRGFISFDDDGKILVSSYLNKECRAALGITDDMRINLSEKNKAYLQYHRNEIFQK